MKILVVFILLLTLISCASQGIIGVIYNQYGVVRRVFKDSPAEKAGIIIGDKILNPHQLKGTIGTQCLVKIQRDGLFFEKLVERVNAKKLKTDQW